MSTDCSHLDDVTRACLRAERIVEHYAEADEPGCVGSNVEPVLRRLTSEGLPEAEAVQLRIQLRRIGLWFSAAPKQVSAMAHDLACLDRQHQHDRLAFLTDAWGCLMLDEKTLPAPDGSPFASYFVGLLALVVSMENATAPSPAATAFHKAIRRKGEELVQADGPEALVHALAFVRGQAPAKAEHRETILAEAWSGLPGWRQ